MLPRTAWATGFLTQLLLDHLQSHHPEEAARIDPRRFFSGIEGYERVRDPMALLTDRQAWIPEEVLREVLRTAERAAGRKDIAYTAAVDYFTRAAQGGGTRPPSIFEIIAKIFNDVRMVALCSGFWGAAYTTFMRLQAIPLEFTPGEMIILAQCDEKHPPLLSTHYMLKGNYEGFVRLFDGVEEARLTEDFLQHRVRDIVSEFEGYAVEEEGADLYVRDERTRRLVAVFRPVELGIEEIRFGPPSVQTAGALRQSDPNLILNPEPKEGAGSVLRVLIPRAADSIKRPNPDRLALQVIRGGLLRSGRLEHHFREGSLYQAPYSSYRFTWREGRKILPEAAGLEQKIQAITLGLFAYLEELKATQQRLLSYAIENRALSVENVYLRQEIREIQEEEETPLLTSNSSNVRAVLGLVAQVGPTESTVLITGETGTGKELIARRVHKLSGRKDRRFVAINCGAIPDGLLESELFGHERGAFTGAMSRKIGKFEWANGGTVFLDEVAELPPAMQVKLLRVLQERELERVGGNDRVELDIRIIAATNRDLKGLIEKGSFRSDLYYRLNVIQIHLPALRERLEDLPGLAESFLFRLAQRLGKNVRAVSPRSLELMRAYPWPGNIRELENVLERAVTLIPTDRIELGPDLLPSEIREPGAVAAPSDDVTRAVTSGIKEMLDRIEWSTLIEAMKVEGSMDSFLRKIEWAMAQRAMVEYGSKTEAARVLKRTYRWLRKLEKEMEDKPPV